MANTEHTRVCSPEQHAKAGEQSHKNTTGSSASSDRGGARGGSYRCARLFGCFDHLQMHFQREQGLCSKVFQIMIFA